MDVEARDELLDRLKSRSAMLERELREAQRIAHVQVSLVIDDKGIAEGRNVHSKQNERHYKLVKLT